MDAERVKKVEDWTFRFQMAATITWTVLVLPSLLWWRHSIAWVVFMSVWANVAAHGAGLIGAWAKRSTDEG